MPASRIQALKFLETQWSSINDNKIKGICAEVAFKHYLQKMKVHYVTGGWLICPGKPDLSPIPAKDTVCILSREHSFSWQPTKHKLLSHPSVAEISAYQYFRGAGVKTYFSNPVTVNENNFAVPTKAAGKTKSQYHTSYGLEFLEIGHNSQFQVVDISSIFTNFPKRPGKTGMRVYNQTLNPNQAPWSDSDTVASLFWFEYTRYYIQKQFLVSNNDLDIVITGNSGKTYPVEVKSKETAYSSSLGDWFGLDAGPFAKLAYFTANSLQTDALYVVEEVDSARNHIDWWGIKFSDLMRSCSWVIQKGGKGMGGGSSATYKVPKAAFTQLATLLPNL